MQDGINTRFTSNSITKSNFYEDLKNGKEIIYDTNRIVIANLNYENNELEGDAYFYFTNGNLFQKAKFKNGKLIDSLFVYKLDKTLDKIILYDTNHFQKEMTFQNGKLVKEVINNTTQVRSLMYCVNTSNSQLNDSTIISEVSLFYEQNRYPNPYNKLIHSHFTEEQFNNSPYKTIAAVTEYFSDLIPLENGCHVKEFNENGEVVKEGAFGKSEFYSYSPIKISLWKYNPPYQNAFTVFYHDTLLQLNDSLSFNSKGIFTDLDEAGIPISKRHIIEDQQLYNCGQNETYDINTYYVIYEKDSSQHLINGFVKNYYTNGVKQSEGINKNGLPTGIWKYYNDNGSLREIGRYINGKKHGRWLSGDLSKFAYLGDVCLDIKNPEQEELQKILENRLRINETYFENGKVTLRNYFEINK
jgi:antitoxin component YwqK of YwqJK toxin-antitoxin module